MQKFLFIALALCSVLRTSAQPDSSFHLYLLVGQSNMAGRGEITVQEKELTYPGIFVLNKANQWVQARHPLHFDKRIAGVGPGMAFAQTISGANRGKRIGLVPCAVGGTSINAWVPGGYDSATKTHPFDDAVTRIHAALNAGVFKGIIWHQGEADSRPARASVYLDNLQVLIQRLRAETGATVVPFVAGELGTFRPNYTLINTELRKLPSLVPKTAVASSAGLDHKGDTTHFNTAAANELGKRMAEKMLILQGPGK
jgi:hypothetical protein